MNLANLKKQFEYSKSLGDKTIAQLSSKELVWQYNNSSNSIAMLVQHISGNMLSRFTDFLISDGEKPWRERDKEFEIVLEDKQQIVIVWEQGWQCLLSALDELQPEDLDRIIYIRNMGHTVEEALSRQMAHYSYHIGQMVMLGKMIKGDKWQTLSIAKGASDAYNQEKFGKGKRIKHFTDDL